MDDDSYKSNKRKITLLKELYLCGQQKLFATKSIMAMLDFKWKTYGGYHYRRSLLAFIIYVCFFAFSTNNFANVDSVLYVADGSYQVRITETQGNTELALHILLIIWSLYYLICSELRSVWLQGLRYYLDSNNLAYNICEVMTFSTVILALTINEIPGYKLTANLLASLAALQVYLQVFLRTRCFEATGPFISMVKTIILDMGYFVILAVVTLFAFAQAYYVLITKTQVPGEFEGRYETLNDWLYCMYLCMLGQFAPTLSYFDNGTSTDFPWVAHLLFIVFSIAVIIIELNLLIAIMGGTFGRVWEDGTDDDWRFEQAGVIVSIEDGMSTAEIENGKYFPSWIHVLVPSQVSKTPEEEREEKDSQTLEKLQDMLGDVKVMLRKHEASTRKMAFEMDMKCDFLELEAAKLNDLQKIMTKM